ncbi:MAG: hypothetical protein AB1797_11545 [bacterium]
MAQPNSLSAISLLSPRSISPGTARICHGFVIRHGSGRIHLRQEREAVMNEISCLKDTRP